MVGIKQELYWVRRGPEEGQGLGLGEGRGGAGVHWKGGREEAQFGEMRETGEGGRGGQGGALGQEKAGGRADAITQEGSWTTVGVSACV